MQCSFLVEVLLSVKDFRMFLKLPKLVTAHDSSVGWLYQGWKDVFCVNHFIVNLEGFYAFKWGKFGIKKKILHRMVETLLFLVKPVIKKSSKIVDLL